MSLTRFGSGIVRSSDTEDESSEEDILSMIKKANPKAAASTACRRKGPPARPAPTTTVKEKPKKFDLAKLAAMKKEEEASRRKIAEADKAIAEANEELKIEDVDEILKSDKKFSRLTGAGKKVEDSMGDIYEWKFYGGDGSCSTGHIEAAVESYQAVRQLGCPEWLQEFETDPLVREQMLLSGFAETMSALDPSTPAGLASSALDLSTKEPREDFSAAYYYLFDKCKNDEYTVQEDDIKGVVDKFSVNKEALDLNHPIVPTMPDEKGIKFRDRYKTYWKERLACDTTMVLACHYGKDTSFTASAYACGILLRQFLDSDTFESASLANEIRETLFDIITIYDDSQWPILEQKIITDFTSSLTDLLYHTRAVTNFPALSPRAYLLRQKLASALLFHPAPPQPLTPALIKSFIQDPQASDSASVAEKKLRDTKARLLLVEVLLDDTYTSTRVQRLVFTDCIKSLHTLLKDRPGSSILVSETKDIFDRIQLILDRGDGGGAGLKQLNLQDLIESI